LLEKKFIIESNLNRRHLNDAQKVEMGLPLLAIEEELAKRRQEATQLAGKDRDGRPIVKTEIGPVHLNLTEKGQARDIVAKKVGVKPARAMTYCLAARSLGGKPCGSSYWLHCAASVSFCISYFSPISLFSTMSLFRIMRPDSLEGNSWGRFSMVRSKHKYNASSVSRTSQPTTSRVQGPNTLGSAFLKRT
jgi:hypothetical protein